MNDEEEIYSRPIGESHISQIDVGTHSVRTVVPGRTLKKSKSSSILNSIKWTEVDHERRVQLMPTNQSIQGPLTTLFP